MASEDIFLRILIASLLLKPFLTPAVVGGKRNSVYIERSRSACALASRISSFWNFSPLYTTVSKNVISFPEISAVNFIYS